ncbi:MAG: DUF4397 domain-containing protein [Schleiferiaceae bacterium]|nr:DUF4397 domain-containing protein [Schleiferiaceae bacterium]
MKRTLQIPKLFRLGVIPILFGMLVYVISTPANAQIVLTTDGASGYDGSNSVFGASAVTFVVENSNATPVILENIDVFWQTVNNNTVATLWSSGTDLSGLPSISTPAWTNHATSSAIAVPANGYYRTFSNLNLTIPANTTLRFAVESTTGIRYSGPTPVPTPSTFTSGGVSLHSGNFQINNQNIGYGGSFANPANNPRWFTGGIELIPAVPCVTANVDSVNALPATICLGDSTDLSATGISFGTNTQFQWQSSADNVTWANIAGDTNSTARVAPSADTYYRLIVNCGTSVDTSASRMVTVQGGPIAGGTYTINSAAPTAGTNFQSFGDFSQFLSCGQITGPIVVDVAPNSGPYNERLVFGAINGASAMNTITINGNGNTLAWEALATAERATLVLDGTDHMTIDDLRIEANGSSWGWAVWMTNEADHNTFTNCEIISSTSSTSTFFAGIVMSGSPTGATTLGNNGSFNTFENNVFDGGYYGIIIIGQSSTILNQGNKILNNVIKDWHLYGVYASAQEDLEVVGNDINRATRTLLSTFYGIALLNNSHGAYVAKNAIHDAASAGNTTTGSYPFYASGTSGTAAKPIRIENNIAYNMNSNGLHYSIYLLGNSDFYEIYHNTLLAENAAQPGSSTIANFYHTGNVNNIDLRNNIFTIDNGSAGAQRHVWFSNANATFNFDHNVYFNSSATGVVGRLGTNDFASLALWQNALPTGVDANTIIGNPVFANPSQGLLNPLSPVANNNGASLGVLEDFSGATRPATNPDRGALEFTPITADLALVDGNLLRGTCYSTTDTASFQVTNTIGSAVNFATDNLTIVWSVTGPVSSNGTLVINSGTLAPEGTTTFFDNSVDMSLPGTYDLTAWILPNNANLSATNDTLSPVSLFVRPIIDVQPKTITLASATDTEDVTVLSPFLNSPMVYISEQCHFKTAAGAPTAGWPSYLTADDYIEITGVAGFDLDGWVLEQYNATTQLSSVTFGPGTVFSPNGTMIVAVGQLGSSTPSPSNFYYHGTGTFTGLFNSGDVAGRVLKDPSGNIVDAVGYGNYTFPAVANVPTSEWSNPVTGATGSSTSGFRLIGPDVNTGASWEVTSTALPQDPNDVNAGTTLPTLPSTPGFEWTLNGVVVDTIPSITVGPFPGNGVYTFVASVPSPCGVLVDSVVVTVGGPEALLQVIHNVADAAAASVDIWVNDAKVLPNLNYQDATSFLPVPANVAIDISVQPANSTDTVNALFRQTYTLNANENYIAIANGIVSGSGYNPSPAFDLSVFAGARLQAATPGSVDILVFHGSTDAPTVNVNELTVPVPAAITNLSFRDFDGYSPFVPLDYELEVEVAATGTAVGVWEAPLLSGNFTDSAVVLIATGFVDPSQNNNGEPFGILAVLPNGTVIPLNQKTAPTARLQVIHNAADPAAATVDVWVNDVKLIPDFEFRTATPFDDVPAETPLVISIQPANSTDTVGALFQTTVNLDENETYIVVANGVVSASGFNPATPFDLFVYAGAQEVAGNASETDVLVFHGATDAPAVDIDETTLPVANLVSALAYGDFDGYLNLTTADYELLLRVAGGNELAAYAAPLQTLNLDGAAITVLASGFVNPGDNSNGPAFGLWAALPIGGNLVPLPVLSGIGTENLTFENLVRIFPNPAANDINIAIKTSFASDLFLEVVDAQGKSHLVRTIRTNGMETITLDVSNMSVGQYFVRIQAGNLMDIQSIQIIR